MTTAETLRTQASSTAQQLRAKIDDGSAVVGIIGLGYVGLPLAHAFHVGGLRVIGFDVDQSKIDKLATGENYLKHLGAEMTTTLSGSDRFTATNDFSRLGECDAVIVAVPTPLGKHHEPDLSYLLGSARDIGRSLRPGQLISLESTTYPGTTRGDFLPALLDEARKHAPGGANDIEVGENLFIAFSPEREDPGRKDHDTTTIPKLVGGLCERSTELATLLYSKAVKQAVPVKSAEVAEAAKLLENIYRCVNIALVNELKLVLDRLDVDVWEVVEAAATKPFGFMKFTPGPGMGGHCIPVDPFYLAWAARRAGVDTRFVELAGEINRRMPEYVVERTRAALEERGRLQTVMTKRSCFLDKSKLATHRGGPESEFSGRAGRVLEAVLRPDPVNGGEVGVRVGRAEVVQLGVKYFEVICCILTYLGFREVRTTLVCQCTQRHILQAVAGRADFGVDFQTTLKLVLIEGPERTFKREVYIFDVASAAGCHRTTCRKGQGRNCGDC